MQRLIGHHSKRKVGRKREPLGRGSESVERSRDWMGQAESDLRHAELSLRESHYDWACFAAQQAAEKAVKALLQKLGAEAWGHSVAELLQHLSGRLRPASQLLDAGLELDKAYIPSRYPNAHPSGAPHKLYTKREASRLVEHAKAIVEFCKSEISSAEQERSGRKDQ